MRFHTGVCVCFEVRALCLPFHFTMDTAAALCAATENLNECGDLLHTLKPSVLQTDLPEIAELKQLPTLEGCCGSLTIDDCFDKLWSALQNIVSPIVVEAPTGCGKSKKLPSFLVSCIMDLKCQKPLLVLTSATIDVLDMYNACQYSAEYKLGRGRKSLPVTNPQCVFGTIGVAARWYASNGSKWLAPYSAVVCDELHEVLKDMEFALLWEMAIRHAKDKRFYVIGATATINNFLLTALGSYGAHMVTCGRRPFDLALYEVAVPTVKDIYTTICLSAASLLRRGFTILMFLPGKVEIADAKSFLLERGVSETALWSLHGELSDEAIENAKEPCSENRIVLATNIAEAAVTIPDIDIVLDSGVGRTAADEMDRLHTLDYRIPASKRTQRAGRAGRTKDGACAFWKPADCLMPMDVTVCMESVCRVVALEVFFPDISTSACRLCEAAEDLVAEASVF